MISRDTSRHVNKRELGRQYEEQARKLMESRGYRFVCANYHCRLGEIDLVMEKDHQLVFVEVRYRHHSGFGSALESVDRKKQRRLIKTAQHFISTNKSYADRDLRFDVIGFDATDTLQFDWIENAIWA